MMHAGFDFTSLDAFFNNLPRVIAEIAAIYFAVRQGCKHGNGK